MVIGGICIALWLALLATHPGIERSIRARNSLTPTAYLHTPLVERHLYAMCVNL